MDDVLATYERPYNAKEPVICLDEKPVQLLADVRHPQPMRPDRDARRDYEYVRCGTANVFLAVEPQTGRSFADVTQRRKCEDFAEELRRLERRYSTAKTIHLVMDNLSSHSCNALCKAFGDEEGKRLWSRFSVHFTPAHASWLNQAENGISKYRRGALVDVASVTLQSLSTNQRLGSRRQIVNLNRCNGISPVQKRGKDFYAEIQKNFPVRALVYCASCTR